jgi:hypothetical protein
MVVARGLVQAMLLPLAGIGAIYLHHRHVPRELRPSSPVTFALWATTGVMAAAGVYALCIAAGAA